MSGHSALRIQEILLETFRHLIGPPGSDLNDPIPTDRKTLLSAALACKAFSSPALDVLWRNMDSAIPLLKILPIIEVGYVLVRCRLTLISYRLKLDMQLFRC